MSDQAYGGGGVVPYQPPPQPPNYQPPPSRSIFGAEGQVLAARGYPQTIVCARATNSADRGNASIIPPCAGFSLVPSASLSANGARPISAGSFPVLVWILDEKGSEITPPLIVTSPQAFRFGSVANGMRLEQSGLATGSDAGWDVTIDPSPNGAWESPTPADSYPVVSELYSTLTAGTVINPSSDVNTEGWDPFGPVTRPLAASGVNFYLYAKRSAYTLGLFLSVYVRDQNGVEYTLQAATGGLGDTAALPMIRPLSWGGLNAPNEASIGGLFAQAPGSAKIFGKMDWPTLRVRISTNGNSWTTSAGWAAWLRWLK